MLLLLNIKIGEADMGIAMVQPVAWQVKRRQKCLFVQVFFT